MMIVGIHQPQYVTAFVPFHRQHSQQHHPLRDNNRNSNDDVTGTIQNIPLFADPPKNRRRQSPFDTTVSVKRRSVVTNGLLQCVLLPVLPSLLISTIGTIISYTPSAQAAVTSSSPSIVPNKKDLQEEYRQGTAALNSALEEDMAPVPREAYVKLPSGVIYADVVKPKASSNTNVVQVGSKVNIQWVLRRSNGYFVDSSQINDSVPFVFTVGDTTSTNGNTNTNTAIAGLDEGIRGMAVGGVRRLLIPPALAYVNGVDDGYPGPIPVGFGPRQQIRRIQNVRKDVPGEYIYLEIQLTRLR